MKIRKVNDAEDWYYEHYEKERLVCLGIIQ